MSARRGTLIAALFLMVGAALGAPARAGEQQTEASARAAFARGELALQEGRIQEAIDAFRQVALFIPDDAGVQFRLGQALFLAGDPEGIEHLEIARDASGGRPEVAFLLAQAYLAAQRYRKAADALDAVERAAPEVPDVELVRGELCYLVGRLDGARKHLQRAADLGPADWPQPLYRLGLTAVAGRRWRDAVGDLERAVEAAPEDAEAWLLLATARNRAGDPTGSTAAMERAVEVAPGNVVGRLILAERYDFAGRVAELAAQVEAILAIEPANSAALLHRANRSILDGRFTEALVDLDLLLGTAARRPVAAGPTGAAPVTTDSQLRAEARRRRIDVLSRLGRNEEALADARRLVTDEPDFADGHFVLGNLLVRAGQADEGRTHLERFKQMSDSRVRRGMGDNFLETSDDPALAEAEFEAALAQWPADRRALLGLARVRRLQGRYEEALELLDRARGVARAVETWFAEVILSLDAAGRYDEARRFWEQGLTLGLPFGPEVWRVVYVGDFGCG